MLGRAILVGRVKLWRCDKQNSTHPIKLLQPQQALLIVHCGSYKFEGSCRNARAATMHEVLPLVHCGCRSTRGSSRALRLVHCGGAAVGIEAPQYKPFYTVPILVSE